MAKSNVAKRTLALSVGALMLGGLAFTGLAGAGVFHASAEEDPNKLILETVDEFATMGYKIEEANADNDSDENPFDSAENPYDYILTISDSTDCFFRDWANDVGQIGFGDTGTAVFNIKTQSGTEIQGGGSYRWDKIWDCTSSNPDIGNLMGDKNAKTLHPEVGGRPEGMTSGPFLCGETVLTATGVEPSSGRYQTNDCTTHGEAVACTCWKAGEGQGESLVGKYLRILYRVVHIEDREFSFTGMQKDVNNPEQGAWIRYDAHSVLGVATADEEWTHAEWFINDTENGATKFFFQNVYFLEGYDLANATAAPTDDALAGKDLYTLMNGHAEDWWFQTEVRADHIEIFKGNGFVKGEPGNKVNYAAGDAFYFKAGLNLPGHNAGGNWTAAQEGGSKNVLANDQMFVFDGTNWSVDQFGMGVTIDKTNVLAEVDGDTATITATVETGKFVSAADKAVTWTSSDETVATVADGVVTGVKAGEATVTATLANGAHRTCSVTVVNATDINEITVARRNETLYTKGEQSTATISVTITGGSKAPQNVTFASNDEEVATVDAEGKITAVAEGTAVITVTAADGKTATVNVTVFQSAEEEPDPEKPGDNDPEKPGDDNKGGNGCGSVVSGSIAAAGVLVVALGAVFVVRKQKNSK